MIKEIEGFLKNHINGNITVVQGDSFLSEPYHDRIILGKRYKGLNKYIIQEAYKELNIKLPCEIETFAILHEAGHIQTLGGMEQELFDALFYAYQAACEEFDKGIESIDQFVQYSELAIEKIANEWALDFMRSNPELTAELNRTVIEYYNKLEKGERKWD